ncbi:MAG: AIM24 family protein, partial [candidate division NC10 bacterium]
MKYKITGDNLQFVNIELSSGEKVYAEAGTMAYMT